MKIARFRSFLALLLPVLLLSILAASVMAFDSPLSPEAIRDAYFLATGDGNKKVAFFDQYTHKLPAPDVGPNIASIEIETPFAGVVDQIATHDLNYRAPDAQQDFLGKPTSFRVVVQIYFTQTYPAPATTAMQLGRFWDDFQIHLMQGGEIQARSEGGSPIYSDQTISGYIGAMVAADYDVDKIQSGPVTVSVTGPDGSKAESDFDLSNLR
jgi:hypothetical protein